MYTQTTNLYLQVYTYVFACTQYGLFRLQTVLHCLCYFPLLTVQGYPPPFLLLLPKTSVETLETVLFSSQLLPRFYGQTHTHKYTHWAWGQKNIVQCPACKPDQTGHQLSSSREDFRAFCHHLILSSFVGLNVLYRICLRKPPYICNSEEDCENK